MSQSNKRIKSRLGGAVALSDQRRLDRLEQNRTVRSRDDSPEIDERKLTQQEAAAYCGVSSATIKRWEAQGLQTAWKGNRRRYRVAELKRFMGLKQAPWSAGKVSEK